MEEADAGPQVIERPRGERLGMERLRGEKQEFEIEAKRGEAGTGLLEMESRYQGRG